jgi:hypothetical protein
MNVMRDRKEGRISRNGEQAPQQSCTSSQARQVEWLQVFLLFDRRYEQPSQACRPYTHVRRLANVGVCACVFVCRKQYVCISIRTCKLISAPHKFITARQLRADGITLGTRPAVLTLAKQEHCSIISRIVKIGVLQYCQYCYQYFFCIANAIAILSSTILCNTQYQYFV